MSTTLSRSPLTTLLVSTLEGTGKPVGDGIIPDAGWKGDPDTPGSTFTPFLVISEVTASHSWGTLADPESDWQLPYVVEAFGASRAQCGWMADRARTALTGLAHTSQELGADSYGVMQIRQDSIGAPVRIDTTEPPIWHSQDGLTVWVTKEN